MPRLGLPLAGLLLAGLLLVPLPAQAAGLAQEHTVLYYLIEMQRRISKDCNGRPMPDAPSLTPSEKLRALAQESQASGRSPEAVAAASGLAGLPFAVLRGTGNTARQVFDSLMGGQCADLMGADHRYIGAAGQNGRWIVLLAAAESGPAPAQFAPQGPGPDAAPAGTPAQERASSPQNAPSGWIDGGEVRYPASRQAEAAPASPVPVGEMRLDAAGRPVGPVFSVEAPLPGEPDAVPGLEPDLLPDTADGAFGDPGEAGARAGTGFVPPGGPGPFGPQAQPQQQAAPPRPGVTPLSDSRPPREDAFVYRAPGLEAEDPARAPDVGAGGGHAPGLAPRPGAAPVAVAPPDGRAAVPAGSPAGSPAREAAGPLLALINAERARGGLCGGERLPPAPALSLNADLTAAAMEHAADMAARGYFSSSAPGGPDLGGRVSDTGYIWSHVAENLAGGQKSPQDAVMGWLAVSAQCKNLLDADFIEAGVGRDPSGRYWVLTLAAPIALDEGVIRLEREPR